MIKFVRLLVLLGGRAVHTVELRADRAGALETLRRQRSDRERELLALQHWDCYRPEPTPLLVLPVRTPLPANAGRCVLQARLKRGRTTRCELE